MDLWEHEFVITEVQKLWEIRSHAGSLDSFCIPCKGAHVKSGIWAEISLAFADHILGPGITELHPRKGVPFSFHKGTFCSSSYATGRLPLPRAALFLICRNMPYRLVKALRLCTPPWGEIWSAVRENEENAQREAEADGISPSCSCVRFQLSLGHSCSLIFFQAI